MLYNMKVMQSPALASLDSWINRVKLRHLKVLLVIASEGSLTAAAAVLHMSQPAASKWLLDLEASLGVQLFIRGRRLRPTPSGEALLMHAERILGDARRVHEELEAIREGSSGVLRIGIMGIAAPVLMPRVIHRLRDADSSLRIVLIEDIAVGLWSRFERNELDIIVGRLGEHPAGTDFPAEPLCGDRYCVIAGPGHPLAGLHTLTWEDAARYPWILPPSQTPLRRVIDAQFTSRGLRARQPWLESTSITLSQVLLRASDCLAVSSHSIAQHYESLGVLKALPLGLDSGASSVSVVWRDLRPPPVITRVLGMLRAVARELEPALPAPQPQRVEDDRSRAQAHGKRRDHG